MFAAWQAIHDLRAAYQADDPAHGKKIATKILQIFSTCRILEIARLGRTLWRWKDAFLAYFTPNRADNRPTEALNGIIELHRHLARGVRNRENYRLRMLLACGRLTHNKPPMSPLREYKPSVTTPTRVHLSIHSCILDLPQDL